MATIVSTPNQVTVEQQVVVVGNPTIQNVVIVAENIEQVATLPANTKKVFLNARGSSQLRLAYTAGGTSSAYKVIRPGVIYESPVLDGSSLTLYLQSNQASETVEIESWA